MKSLEEVKEIISKHKNEVERKFKVKSLGLFGSYVKGNQSNKSDIDIIVTFKEPVSLLHIVSLENYMSDLLGIKADIVPEKNIRDEIKRDVLKEVIFI